MRKLTSVAALFAALLLVGCAAQTDDAKALEACVDLVNDEFPNSDTDTSRLVAESFSDALFEAGVKEERDHSKNVFAVSGEVRLMDGDIETKKTVICNVTVEEGEVTDAGITVA